MSYALAPVPHHSIIPSLQYSFSFFYNEIDCQEFFQYYYKKHIFKSVFNF